jgi:undecaprenyl phosphate N,N'-diacetylbacillosamine 1-phosphate transferase
MYKLFLKDVLDRILALILIIIFLPVILITAILIYFKLKNPVVFTQIRPTKDEKLFKIYKFRTMSDERDENGNLLPDEVRLKGFGKTVRELSLDELPQLFNVLKGDISFIGPRPLLVEYLDKYSDFQKQRHLVKGGISGLAQIKGRNNLSWKNKFRYDVFYAKHVSFKLDLYIIWLTILKVIKREDVNQQGKATVEKFQG